MNHTLLLQDTVVRNGTSLAQERRGLFYALSVSGVLELGVPGFSDYVNWHSL